MEPLADRYAPRSVLGKDAGRPGWYVPPDAIELVCPACTLEWGDGGLVHERSCLFGRVRPRKAQRTLRTPPQLTG